MNSEREAFMQAFRTAWAAKTVMVDATDLDKQEACIRGSEDRTPYVGIDFSVNNQWVDVGDLFTFGSPYRKNVTPDQMGTYQAGNFRVFNCHVVVPNDPYATAGFWSPTRERHLVPLKSGLDLFELFAGDGKKAAEAFYHETGMMY